MLATASRFATVTLVNNAGVKIPVNYNPGDRLIEAIENTQASDLVGPCGGNCVCGGCHVIFPEDKYTAPGDDEKEVLDGLAHVTKTSRLGCQITLSEDLNGIEIRYGPKEE